VTAREPSGEQPQRRGFDATALDRERATRASSDRRRVERGGAPGIEPALERVFDVREGREQRPRVRVERR
jgi:hypothetical protein